ncbi:MAG: fibrobacter succinogenes major paralogous domain-containing protein [Bacteroidota bacterium]
MKAPNFFLSFLLLSIFCSCKFDNDTVVIGNDEWMTENLSVKKFNNGDPIPEAKTELEWLEAGQSKSPAWCYQNNDPANGKSYGILYNYYAVSDERGLLPEGFHLATDVEWNNLVHAAGGVEVAASRLKDPEYWGGKGNGSSLGFNARPGGVRIFDGGFSNMDRAVYFWTATEESVLTHFYFRMQIDNDKVDRNYGFINYGMYLRCVKNK